MLLNNSKNDFQLLILFLDQLLLEKGLRILLEVELMVSVVVLVMEVSVLLE